MKKTFMVYRNMLTKRLKGVYHCILRYRFNVIKTLVINLRLLPLRQALRLPIVIYAPCELLVRRSRLVFDNVDKVKFGMMAFGRNDDMMVSGKMPMLIMILDSVITAKGSFRMSPGGTLRMSHGKLSLGDKVVFGGGG